MVHSIGFRKAPAKVIAYRQNSGTHESLSAFYEQFRELPTSDLRGWIWLAACLIGRFTNENPDEHYRRVMTVAAYCFHHKCSLFHACWELSTKQYPCHCAPCSKR